MALAALASGYSLLPRFKEERENRAVGLALELATIKDAGAASGKTLSETLAELQSHGLIGVVINEDTVGDLVLRGQASLTNVSAGMLISVAPQRATSLRTLLKARFGEKAVGETSPMGTTRIGFIVQVDGNTLRTTAAGIDSQDAKAVRDQGLELIVRHGNGMGVNQAVIEATLADSARLGANHYLPLGDQVLGNRELLKVTQQALIANKMNYLSAEFGKISGDNKMISEMPTHVIRLHTAQQAETDRLSPAGLQERYTKAFRERNIRWLLLRPVTLAGGDPVEILDQTLKIVKGGVIKEGGGIKPPRPYSEPETDRWIFPVIGLLISPVVAFVFYAFVPKIWWAVGVGVVFAALGGLCWFDAARSYVALAGAVAFPMAGFVWLIYSKPHPVLGYLGLSLAALVGGLCVAGLLVGLKYMIQADMFSGVKVAHFGPIFLVALLGLIASGKVKEAIESPAQWGSLVGGLVLVGAVAFMLSRTGNDNPAGVSDLELRIRSLLEALLATRPRTKEFLIGHPALVVGLGFLAWSRTDTKWFTPAVICLAIAAIGQASVVNTLCHLHSPLDLALLRIGIGHLMGCIIGVVAWFGLSALLRSRGGGI